MKCIDHNTNNFCHTGNIPTDLHPWLALDLGTQRAVKKVVVYNRAEWGNDLRDLEVRISNWIPETAEEVFTEGSLLGNFDGWGKSGQVIIFGQEVATMGRYVVVQHNAREVIQWKENHWTPDNGDPNWAGAMDIAEVKVFVGKLM